MNDGELAAIPPPSDAAERRAARWAFAAFFVLLASLYLVRPLRDELGIESGVRNMQWLFSGTFAAILVTVPLYGALASRVRRGVLVPLLYVVLAATMVVLWWGLVSGRATAVWAAITFVWLSVSNMIAVSAFWSLLADSFRPEVGRRRFGRVSAGGSAGALAGPLAASLLVGRLQPASLLLVGAACLVVAAWCATQIAAALGHRASDSPMGGSLWAGLVLVVRSPMLRGIAGYLLLMTWVATTMYFEQATIVDRSALDEVGRTRLFARMDLAVNAISVLGAAFVTGPLIGRLGLASVLMALPLVSIGSLACVALVPTLGVLVGVQVIRRAAHYALSKPAREILFCGLTPPEVFKGKNVTDTVVYRGGDAAAGWMFAGLSGAGLTLPAIAWCSVPVALVWAFVGAKLGRRAERGTSPSSR